VIVLFVSKTSLFSELSSRAYYYYYYYEREVRDMVPKPGKVIFRRD